MKHNPNGLTSLGQERRWAYQSPSRGSSPGFLRTVDKIHTRLILGTTKTLNNEHKSTMKGSLGSKRRTVLVENNHCS